MKKLLLILPVLLTTYLSLFAESEKIPLFSYHTHIPFYTGEGYGLSYDLARYLTVASHGKYQFNLIPMSRSRVDKMLEANEKAVIPWVNPVWFNDTGETLFHWTGESLFSDQNAVISNRTTMLEYTSPQVVAGLVFGGVRGHHYKDIDQMVKEGSLIRMDAENHIDNFRKLVKGRIDFTIAPLSGAEYIIHVNQLQDALYISRFPHSTYTRRCIVSGGNPDLEAFMETTVSEMKKDPAWLKILENYNISGEH